MTGEQIRDACRAVGRQSVRVGHYPIGDGASVSGPGGIGFAKSLGRGMVEFSGPVYDGGGSRLATSEADTLAEIRRLVALAGGASCMPIAPEDAP